MRYTPHTEEDVRRMLDAIGVSSVEELFRAVPDEIRLKRPLGLAAAMDDMAVETLLAGLAEKTGTPSPCFTGGGIYDHYIPPVVDALAGRSEFYTAYTPYQPEASQGHLQIFFEYQTMICRMTGMEISNASLYDGGSALAEASLMACRMKRGKAVAAASTLNPAYLRVLSTYLRWADIPLRIVDADPRGRVDEKDLAEKLEGAAVFLFQNPNFFGVIEDGEAVCSTVHAAGAYAAVSVDPVSLAVLKRPGDYGADIVTGEGQPLGNPPYYGGHGFGILAARKEFTRKMPGRIVGKTTDRNGNPCYVLTLQTREQHIRRGRATSNICSNQAWCVTRAVIYCAALGPTGLRIVAEQAAAAAHVLAARCAEIDGFGITYRDSPFFREFVLSCPSSAAEVNLRLKENGITGGIDLGRFYGGRENEMLVATTEKISPAHVEAFVKVLESIRK